MSNKAERRKIVTSHGMLLPQVGTEHLMLVRVSFRKLSKVENQDFIGGHEGYRCDDIL